ncbi:MAG: hypothetical protein L0G21_07480, partial [Lactococcus raffinolactis]|nr:hypothetical protein [Lactococcus raffinolactis]
MIHGLESSVSALANQINDLYGKSSSAFSMIHGLEDSVSHLTDVIGDLRAKSDSAFTMIHGLESSVSALANQINDLYGKSSSAFSMIHGLEDSVSHLTDVIGDLRAKSDSAFTMIHGLESSVSALANQINDLYGKSSSAFNMIHGLEESVSHLADVVGDLRSKSDSAFTMIHGVEGTVSAAYVDINNIKAKDVKQDSDILALSAQVKSLPDQIADLFNVAGIIHAIDSVGDKLQYLVYDASSPLKYINLHLVDIWDLLDGTIQKILDKLISIDNRDNGSKSFFEVQAGKFFEPIKNIQDWLQYLIYNESSPLKYMNIHLNGIEGISGYIKSGLADFQASVSSSFSVVSSLLKDVISTIKAIKIPVPESSDPSGGGSIWDFLKELVKAVASIVKALADLAGDLLDMLLKVFVPSDMSFVSTSFDHISEKFDKKFAIFIDFGSSLKGLFSSRRALADFSLSFSGTSVVVPLSLVSTLAGQIRPLLTGLFVLLTVIGVYRRFTDGEVVS